MSDNMKPRSILKFFLAVEQSEGVGARVRRSIGTMNMRNFPPFLMLDHFDVNPKTGGFPMHPHSGQETITYITQGQMAHEDFTGSLGILNPGDLQFMTAGKAVVHSEMPVPQEDGKNCIGMQLWVDLPLDLKECAPRYRDLRKLEIPVAKPNDDIEVNVISGESYGVGSVKDLAYTPVQYFHYSVKKGASFEQAIPTNFNTFLYLMKGSLVINDTKIPRYNAVFFNRDGESVTGTASEDSEFVLIGGEVFNQPIIQHGPFVAVSKEKIYEKFMSYQSANNGFENLRKWESLISEGIDDKVLKQMESIIAEQEAKSTPSSTVKRDEF